jgi:hypothetical protein
MSHGKSFRYPIEGLGSWPIWLICSYPDVAETADVTFMKQRKKI